MFASRTTDDVEVPGGSVKIRRLSYLQLEAAERAKRKQAIAALVELQAATSGMEGVGEVLAEAIRTREAQRASQAADAPPAPESPGDPLEDFDQRTVLVSGLVSVTLDGKTEKFTDAMADDLDEEIAPLLTRAILRLTKPSLFQSAEAEQAAEKNA